MSPRIGWTALASAIAQKIEARALICVGYRTASTRQSCFLSGISDHISFLKAGYCHSILATAANSDDEGARHLVDCLATEIPTTGTSMQVATAEREAIQLIVHPADRIQSRTIASAIAEWRHASDAVLRWINAAG